MSSLNQLLKDKIAGRTHEGLAVPKISAEAQLTRLTLGHMLWEDSFYVNGQDAATAVLNAVKACTPEFTSVLAYEARTKYKLRHIPLLLLRGLASMGKLKSEVLADTIQRPDEMSEFLSIYWKDGKTPLANQVKKGLAKAFGKFNAYQLAKWDKNSAAIKLRDVMFLCHPEPKDSAQELLFAKIANQTLEAPDTWEVQLSGGADKAEAFTRLMSENKLGALAFLRNLRNMLESGISEDTIRDYAKTIDISKVLPFRYMAAKRVVPQLTDMLEDMMLRSLESHEKLMGKTAIVVDVSGSMFGTPISAKSDLDRFDAAAALAILAREICEDVEIFSFSNDAVRVPAHRGFALGEAISRSQSHGGTYLGRALSTVQRNEFDRVIVFTDEQSADRPNSPAAGQRGYIINVAAYQNGINNAAWTTISGFSEAVIDYIQAVEKL